MRSFLVLAIAVLARPVFAQDNEAERLFAAGEPPRSTIDVLRRAVSVEGARPPSVRTMMRWHSERRWLSRGRRGGPAWP